MGLPLSSLKKIQGVLSPLQLGVRVLQAPHASMRLERQGRFSYVR